MSDETQRADATALAEQVKRVRGLPPIESVEKELRAAWQEVEKLFNEHFGSRGHVYTQLSVNNYVHYRYGTFRFCRTDRGSGPDIAKAPIDQLQLGVEALRPLYLVAAGSTADEVRSLQHSVESVIAFGISMRADLNRDTTVIRRGAPT